MNPTNSSPGREPSCVLRLEPERVAFDNRQRGFACMAAAAAAEVAPPVYYSDPATGVAVMAFVEGRPLAQHRGGPDGLARELGHLSARIRATPPFPLLGGGGDVVAFMLAHLIASNAVAPGLLDPHAEGLARLRAAIPWDLTSLVSSHNDPNPRNMIFDGRRV